jgi:hypothetical protein
LIFLSPVGLEHALHLAQIIREASCEIGSGALLPTIDVEQVTFLSHRLVLLAT